MATDAQARERLIEQHIPLVRSIARRYAGSSEPLDDLVQAGSVGLIKAVDRFDPARGEKLASLAAPAIEGEIRHHLRDRIQLVRVPRGVRELGAKVGAEEERLTARDGRAPGAAQLAEAVGAPEAAVVEALLARRAGSAAELDDEIAAAAPDASAEDRAALAQAWSALTVRERTILELRFRDDLSQSQIAKRVGRSQAQVSRSLASALAKLRAAMGAVAPGPRATYSEPAMDEAQEGAQQRSGRFLVRMPQTLHDALAREAEREGVSLNTLITNALAGAVGWRDGAPHDDPAAPAPPPKRATNRMLVLNLVVVGVVAIAAVILLVLAATNA